MMEDLSGRVIRGYELRQLIGEGGFGAVYLAHQHLIGREVAVKIILPQYANQPDFIRRFDSEAQLVARLEHPHIVPLYDYWREPSGAYLVMRYLRGGSLHQSLDKEGSWKAGRVSEMLTQVAAALTVAHRQGVIHRDLKPENILLDENGNAYLSDFGIAKDLARIDSITQNNAIIGSPAYISPEQIKGEPLTPQTDIYMLGTMLYEMLTGAHPYGDTTSAALLYKHLSEPVPELAGDIPPALNAVIHKATAKNTNERYKDVLELASDFRRAVRTGGIVIDKDERAITSGTLTMPEPENPYKGLRAFQQADAADFFGRENLTHKLLDRLHEDSPYGRFLAVVGPSGSGKSSVVKAGLLPVLQKGGLPDSDKWFIVEMVPGLDPMEELEATLLRVAVNPPDSLLSQLNEDERGFLRAVKRVLPGDDSQLLLVIDQFEELYTLVEEEEQRTRFMDSLIVATTDPRSQIRVIITLRADFYDRPLNYVRFGELIQQRTEIVLPLTTDEIEAAVTRPAERVGLQLERGLVTAIVADVKEQPGALPLLQYALTELYERREAHTLTHKAYHDIGGTLGALAQRADELYAGLGKDGQEAARQMFLRLVTLGEGAEDTRRRVFQSELLSIGTDRETMELVLDAFGRYRLLTFDNDPQTRMSTVEVAHEALIRQWGRLREWLSASREDLRLQRRVTAASQDWLESKRDNSFLARGSYLDQLESWYKTSNLAVTDSEREYMEASITLREHQRAQELERQQREEALELRSRNRLRALVAVLAAAAVIASVLSVFAISQSLAAQEAQREAEIARDMAEANAHEASSLALSANARSALTEGNPMLALSLSLEANAVNQPPTIEVSRMLANAAYAPGTRYRMTGHTGAVLQVDYSPDGLFAASVSADGTLRTWDTTTGTQAWEAQIEGIITSVSYSPDGGQYLVTGGTDQIAHLWDAQTGEIVRDFTGHTNTITSVAFSPDGTSLLTGALDQSAIIWDVATGEISKTFDGSLDAEKPMGAVAVVEFSPDGSRILVATYDETITNRGDDFVDRVVRVWDVESGELIAHIEPGSGFVRTVTFTPDNTQVVTGLWDGTNDGTIRFYEIATGEEVRRIYAGSDVLSHVAFSPSGRHLMSAGWDGTLRLWDVVTGVEVQRFQGFNDRVLSFAFSPDGQYLVASTGNLGNNDIDPAQERSRDTSVWLIDLKNRLETRTLTGHEDWVWDVDTSPDGKLAVSGSGLLRPPMNDTTVRVWDIQTGEQLQRMEGHTETVDGVAFAPDGGSILSGAWDGIVILWDATAGEEIRRFTGHGEGNITSVDINADNTLGLSGDNLGVIILWDLAAGSEVLRFEPAFAADTTPAQKEVGSVQFSPDGTQILVALMDKTIRIFDTITGEQLKVFTGHTDRVTSAVFSTDGKWIASGAWDGTARVWDATTGNQVRQVSAGSGAVLTVAFTNDGNMLFSGGADEVIHLWDIATGQEVRRFAGHTNWISAIKLLPDGKSLITGAQDDTIKLWRVDLSPDDLIQWVQTNRYIRPMSCNEQAQYRLPLSAECEASQS